MDAGSRVYIGFGAYGLFVGLGFSGCGGFWILHGCFYVYYVMHIRDARNSHGIPLHAVLGFRV